MGHVCIIRGQPNAGGSAVFCSYSEGFDVTPPQALGFARGAARCRQLRPTASHACERMEQRGVTPRDVVHAVLTSTTVVPDPNRQGRFVLLGGTDVTGHPLSVVIAIEGNVVLVVTIIGK